jgi:hypothetical protein
MAEEFSAEQVREKHLRNMGLDLGPVYHELSNELAWLHAKWNQYRQLFGHSRKRVDLLNSVANHFFRIVQDALWEDIVLHLARLTDPLKSSGKANLTLRRLPAHISDATLKVEVEKLIDVAVSTSIFARDWRNRKLAHIDLALALRTGVEPLAGVSRENIEGALSAFRAVLNRLATHYWKSETAYEHFIASGGEGDSLVFFLRLGLKAEESRMERLRAGKPLPGDFDYDDEA